MTAEPEVITDRVRQHLAAEVEKKTRITVDLHPLEQIFTLGYAISSSLVIINENDIELRAVFRTLTPAEIRDIAELTNLYQDPVAKAITERIETLARAIQTLNSMPLILTDKERDELQNKLRHAPSPLDMARAVIQEKIRSLVIIDALYDAYSEFLEEINKKFEFIKKKRKTELTT
jgi:hypothetical protein